MFDHFTLARYEFTLHPENLIRMPAYNKGNILRGAFGSSLRKIVCIKQKTDCEDCSLIEKCAYTLIFNPICINPAKRLFNTPRGFVIKPPLEITKDYSSEQDIKFEMILIGKSINFLPYVIVPIIELGKWGIGINRGRFKLHDIRVLKGFNSESIFEPDKNTIKNIQLVISGNEITKQAEKISDSRNLTLYFLTPTRIRFNPTGEKGKSIPIRVPEFHHIIRRLRDRINALSLTYCGKNIDIDFKGLAEKARKIKTKNVNLKWIDLVRTSKSQHIQHDISGFIGDITFEGNLKEFLPWLILGEYVHVGEDAVFGNGWYRMEVS